MKPQTCSLEPAAQLNLSALPQKPNLTAMPRDGKTQLDEMCRNKKPQPPDCACPWQVINRKRYQELAPAGPCPPPGWPLPFLPVPRFVCGTGQPIDALAKPNGFTRD